MPKTQVWSLVQEDPLEREVAPIPVFLPGKSHDGGAWRAAFQGVTESGMTERLTQHWNWVSTLAQFWAIRRDCLNIISSVAQSCPTLCGSMDLAHQVSLSITNPQSLLKLISIESVMPSNHLILCHPLLLPPSIFPSIRAFFQWVHSSHQVAKVLELQLQHQSFQWIFRTDFL